MQLDGVSGYREGHPAIVQLRLKSEGSLVRSQLRSPKPTNSRSAHTLIFVKIISESIAGATGVSLRASGRAPRAGVASSLITKVPTAQNSRYHWHCPGRWRGEISKGFWPDGRRRRYKASGAVGPGERDGLGDGGAAGAA